ncbi:hypothetical protein [Acinetobacter bereziniae]|uniref:hypothetical protein n=1 Tax=Acinetobacter bereziniae TaxID=106648 RepID=UPI003AF96727
MLNKKQSIPQVCSWGMGFLDTPINKMPVKDFRFMKHDAHVRTAFMHFFPMKLFIILMMFVFTVGVYVGLGINILTSAEF